MEKIQDLTGWSSDDFAGISHAARHAGNATSTADDAEPCLLLRAKAAGGGLHLDAAEHGQSGAHHVWGDGDRAPADQVSGAASEAKGDQPAGAGIGQGAHLIAEQPGIGSRPERQADLLLQGGFGVHAPRANSPCNSAAALQ